MKTRTIVLSIAAALMAYGIVTAGAKTQSGATQQQNQSTEKRAEEQFKNIQVLKGVPADQIIPTMQFITASLGVECEFCHVQGAFEKDDKKPKQTARKMMEMMFAINGDNFDRHREVTCYTCHRGNAAPVGMPPVMTEDTMKAIFKPDQAEHTAEKANENPALPAEQLLDKYLQSIGGATAVEKITSRVMKGNIEFGGLSAPIEIYAKDPERRISVAHMQEGDSITAFNGHEGWLVGTGHPLHEMHGGEVDGAAMDADLHFATHLKQMFSKMRVRGKENIDGHDAYQVVGERQGKPPIEMYFDEQTGLLVRLVRFGETALGRLPTQIDYADYRDTGGVRIPYRWTLARPSGRFTIQVSEVKQNVPVDDSKFAKPPAPAEPAKGPAK